jgi:hypothetical protein
MTIEYMTKRTLVVVVGLSFLMSPGTLLAQVGTAAATAVRTAVPTGPMSAVTKAAALVKASKAAAAASRGASTAASSGASRASAVTGYLWTANNSPIQNATVQLRNTVTGNVDMYTKTNAVGEFLFTDMKGGSYVIEYVSSASETAVASAASNAGGVIAVGSPFTVAPGETVATFVRLGTKVPWFTGFFSNAASAVAATAASQGITAIAPVQLPLTNNK